MRRQRRVRTRVPSNLSHFQRFSACFLVSAAHYENFPVASFLLPRATRAAVLAIYRFARAADDIADEGDASPAERLAALDRYDQALDAIATGRRPTDAPFAELADAIARHALPVALFRGLLSAFRQDVTTHRYSTLSTLLDYCRRSANPIGRLLLLLHRRDTPENATHSDAICSALQLVNFWQDVAVDWSKGACTCPRRLCALRRRRSSIAETPDEKWHALMAKPRVHARCWSPVGCSCRRCPGARGLSSQVFSRAPIELTASMRSTAMFATGRSPANRLPVVAWRALVPGSLTVSRAT
jgi:squalene synthase HpnC